MSSKLIKPAFYKKEITDEDIKKLEEIFSKMEKDKNAIGFLEPVDYKGLKLFDYPDVVKNPMDLGTCKNKLLNGEYKIFQEFMDDINLIWDNCRLYNMSESDIVKCGNNCEKKMRQLIEKQFKNAKPKVIADKSNEKLTTDDKTKLVDKIRKLSNEDLTQIVKIILKACPDGIEDIDNDKLQIKVDFLTYKELELINDYLEKVENKEG